MKIVDLITIGGDRGGGGGKSGNGGRDSGGVGVTVGRFISFIYSSMWLSDTI